MAKFSDQLDLAVSGIAPLRESIASHPIYGRIRSPSDIRVFMERHVYAVWDFMCLLKGLQRLVTCVDLPWVPIGTARVRRFINEIVLEEESDLIDGVEVGHFELYLRAMEELGADTRSIRSFVDLIRDGVPLDRALILANAPEAAATFVRSTFITLATNEAHVVAASFTFGREDSIPLMFRGLLSIAGQHGLTATVFAAYLERHLLLDGEDHGPKSVEMVRDLCGTSSDRLHEAAQSAQWALRARLRFWDAILVDIETASSRQDETMPDIVQAA